MRCLAVLLLILTLPRGRVAADDLRGRARQEFAQGSQQFDAGNYEVALEHLQRAYALAPYPALLFNIARCFEELHRVGAAIDAYDRYLAVQPHDAVAADHLQALRRQLASATAPGPEPQQAAENRAPQTNPPPTNPQLANPVMTAPPSRLLIAAAPPPQRKPLYRRWWLWTAVAGVVVAGTSVGLAVGLTRPSPLPSFPALGAQ